MQSMYIFKVLLFASRFLVVSSLYFLKLRSMAAEGRYVHTILLIAINN